MLRKSLMAATCMLTFAASAVTSQAGEFGSADEAKAMLGKAVTAVKADKAKVEEEEDWESVAYALERLGETARSLDLEAIADAATATIGRLGKGPVDEAFAPLVKAIRESSPVGPFAPIAIVGNERQVQSIAQQDDGTCEPLQLYNDVRELQRLIVQWPQAIAIPGTAVGQVSSLMRTFGCAVYVYGAARDQNALIAQIGGGRRWLVCTEQGRGGRQQPAGTDPDSGHGKTPTRDRARYLLRPHPGCAHGRGRRLRTGRARPE